MYVNNSHRKEVMSTKTPKVSKISKYYVILYNIQIHETIRIRSSSESTPPLALRQLVSRIHLNYHHIEGTNLHEVAALSNSVLILRCFGW